MNTQFAGMLAVRAARRLRGLPEGESYAMLGALSPYSRLDLTGIREAEGIPDVPAKAEVFHFGAKCGEVLKKELEGWDEEKLLYCNIAAVRAFLTNIPPQGLDGEEAERAKNFFLTAFPALFKRAQIRTHTAKPGFEDINTWLERYSSLQKDYWRNLPLWVDILVAPDPAKSAYTEGFIDKNEPLTALAISGRTPGEAELENALAAGQNTVFDRIIAGMVRV